MSALHAPEISAKTVMIQEYALPAKLMLEQLQIVRAAAGIIRLILLALSVVTSYAMYVTPRENVLPARPMLELPPTVLVEVVTIRMVKPAVSVPILYAMYAIHQEYVLVVRPTLDQHLAVIARKTISIKELCAVYVRMQDALLVMPLELV